MSESLRQIQAQAGAIFEPGSLVPVTFENDGAAVDAAKHGVAVGDRSHWGRIQVSGADHLAFLHNQSTNDFNSLMPGTGCDTVFVTSTARTLDLATVYVLDDCALAIVSPNRRASLFAWLDRYIFFGDKVELTDLTDQTAMFSLIGPESGALLQTLVSGDFIEQGTELADASHRLFSLAGQEVRVAVGSGLALPGYTLIADVSNAALVWQALIGAGAVPLGDRAWDQLRIEQGRPAPDRELTEDYNVVEACLWQAISINKGCYIGQETIARLDTYKGVKQQIWGIRLSTVAAPGSAIAVGEEKVGTLTSCVEMSQGAFGLGYVRTKAGGEGLKVRIGDGEGELVEVPFLRRARE